MRRSGPILGNVCLFLFLLLPLPSFYTPQLARKKGERKERKEDDIKLTGSTDGRGDD